MINLRCLLLVSPLFLVSCGCGTGEVYENVNGGGFCRPADAGGSGAYFLYAFVAICIVGWGWGKFK